MMKDRQDPFSGMSLEELWQLFPVFLTEHRPVWTQWYQEERERLSGILPMEDICEISHVGSTSIPSIWAKPIVDILVEMRECGDMQAMKSLFAAFPFRHSKLHKQASLCMFLNDFDIQHLSF